MSLTRRQTLGALGSVSLASLLAACAGGENAAAPEASASGASTAGAGQFEGAASAR